MIRLLVPLAALALLTACGRSDDSPKAVTAGEQKALDEAAKVVEQQRLDPSAIPPAPLASAAATGQSN